MPSSSHYDNWPDERWIDVRDSSWQSFIVQLGQSFYDKGAFGVYLDNVDVYSAFIEQKMDKQGCATALKNIITGLNNSGLKVMVNGGSEFLDDMFDSNDKIISEIHAYHQEEVFSLIENYEENIFGQQCLEDKVYYQEISRKMKAKNAQIFYLEYTKDSSLISSIDEYCTNNGYFYCVSSTVNLE